MPPRLKRLIGMLMLVTLVIVYALIAMMVAVAQLAEAGVWAHLAFFIVGGFIWVLPAMWIISWMSRGGETQD